MDMFFATMAKAQNNNIYYERSTPWEKLEKVVKLNHVDTRYISVLDYPDNSTLDTINRYLWKELGLQQHVRFTEDITYGEILCMSMAVKYAGDSSINALYHRCRYSTDTNVYNGFLRMIESIQNRRNNSLVLDRQLISPTKFVIIEMSKKRAIIACYNNWNKCIEDNTCCLKDLDYHEYEVGRFIKELSPLWREGFEQIKREIDLYYDFVGHAFFPSLHPNRADFSSFGPDSLEIKNNCAKMLRKKEAAENSISPKRTFAQSIPESDKAKQVPTKIKKLTASFQNNNESQERHRSLARQCHNMRQRGDTASEEYKTNMAEMREIEISYWKNITGSYMKSYNPYPADLISFLKKYPVGYYSDTASILLKKMLFSADSNEGILFFGNISKNFEKEPKKIDSVKVIIIDSIRGYTVSKWPLNRGETKSCKLSPGVYFIERIFNDLDTNPGPIKQIKNFVSEMDTSLNLLRPTTRKITTRVEVTPHSFHKYVFFRYPICDSAVGQNKLCQIYADAKVHAKVRKQLKAKQAKEYQMFMDKLKAIKNNYLQTK